MAETGESKNQKRTKGVCLPPFVAMGSVYLAAEKLCIVAVRSGSNLFLHRNPYQVTQL